jgi:hypothetical protein
MLQRGLVGLESVRSLLHRFHSMSRESHTRPRWTGFIPPLLCGLLGDLCLVLLPFGPAQHHAAGVLILTGIFAVAIGWELLQSQQTSRRMLIELRSTRIGGVERPAFLVPYFPHLMMAAAFLSLLLVGLSVQLCLSVLVDPHRFFSPYLTGWYGFLVHHSFPLSLFGLGLGILIGGKSLPSLFRRQSGLAVCPEGVWSCSGEAECLFPWEAIEKVAIVKVKVVPGPSLRSVGIRLTNVQAVRTAPRRRHGMKRLKARTGWHLLLMPLGYTLASSQISFLLRNYHLHPEQRAWIGAAAELERVKATLQIADR